MSAKLVGMGAVVLALFVGGTAFAQETVGPQGISFPIAELGGCSSKTECKAYCDGSTHADVCLAFAEQHKLMTAEQLVQARKLMSQRGPGGCMGSACKTYCSEKDHFADCQKFAEEHGLTGPQGERPRMSEEPKVNEEKAQQLLAEKEGPGGCKSMAECHAYCEDSSHIKQCLAFAKENGLMGEDDLARAEKFVDQTGPGGCKGLECKAYCEDESHSSECIAFAKENGFISEEEAQRVQTLVEHPGPGGCRGEGCRTYCEDASHREACFEFAKQNGLISEGDLQRMEEFRGRPEEGGGSAQGQGRAPCNSPEECRAMYETQGRQEFPGAGDSRFMGNERFRESGETPPQGMQKPPEGYPMTAEQQKMYEQYQQGKPYTPPSNQPTCNTPEECKAKYETRDSGNNPIEPSHNPQYEQQRFQQMSPQQYQYQQEQFNQMSPEQQQQYQQQYQPTQQYQQSNDTSGAPQPPPPSEPHAPAGSPPGSEPPPPPTSWFGNLKNMGAAALHALFEF